MSSKVASVQSQSSRKSPLMFPFKPLEGDWTVHPSLGDCLPRASTHPVCSDAHGRANGFHSSQWLHLHSVQSERSLERLGSSTSLRFAGGASPIYFPETLLLFGHFLVSQRRSEQKVLRKFSESKEMKLIFFFPPSWDQ